MSCFAALFRPREAPPSAQEIDRMLAPLRPRAPDGEAVVCRGAAGLGQLHLRTGGSNAESAPALTLEGEVFVCADARIDAREELVHELRAAGREVRADAPHAELILHAYHAFGEGLAAHLLGDFAFVVWDARAGKLLCVRDPLGVRPFYLARVASGWAFASQPDALLQLPGVSRALDDLALADFLLFGTCLDAEATLYAQIRCLPPATLLVLQGERERRLRYWQLPQDLRVRLPSEQQYAERFLELFTRAVRDRLPQGPVSLQLSGGMDSTSIAAVTSGLAPASRVSAYHMTVASLAPDPETALTKQVADHLGFDLSCIDVGRFPLFAGQGEAATRSPLPHSSGQLALHAHALQQVAASGARVVLSGWAGDALFSAPLGHYLKLLRRGRWLRLAQDLVEHAKYAGSLRGTGLKQLFKRAPSLPPWMPECPDWVSARPAAEVLARWRGWWAQDHAANGGAEQMAVAAWHRSLETPEYLATPVRLRYPFLDLRLLQFTLGLPPPLLAGKRVLRRAMRGRLPPAVLERPKTALPLNVTHAMVTGASICLDRLLAEELEIPGVDRARHGEALLQARSGRPPASTWASDLPMLPLALKYWLLNRSS